ncbi:MAG: OmpA family protein [Granulosicoccus sp.]
MSINSPQRRNARKDTGSILLWALIWLLGMCALAWTAMSIAMPKFDAKRQIAVTEAASSITDTPIQVSLAGMEATLSGSVESEQQRNSLLGSIGLRNGVLRVRDNLEIIESSVAATAPDTAPVQTISVAQQVDTEKRPSLSIKIIGESLSIEGELAPEDDTTSLLQQALTTFNLDLVNNKIKENNDVQLADWLPELENVVAEMENMANPTIDIKGRQIIFAGDAPSEKVHDAVINQALDSLRTLSIIEQISIDESLADASSGKEPMDVVDGPLAQVETGPTDRALEEDIITQEERLAAEQRLADVQRKAEEAKIAQQEREAAEAQERAEQERLAAEAERIASQESEAESPQSPDTLASTDEEELIASVASRTQLQKALSRLPTLQILFEKNTNLLVEDSEALLQAMAEVLMQFPDITVSIEGHTDSTGPSEVNLTLSLARATAVRDYLVGLGVSELRLRARGFGEAIPITDNDTPQGRATNRRIEFKF